MKKIFDRNSYENSPAVSKKYPRSRFNMSHGVKTSFNTGDVVPIDLIEIYPGDNFKIDLKSVIRGSTLLKPVLDIANVDIYAFFEPHRHTEAKWAEIMGENKESKFVPEKIYSAAVIDSPKDGWDTGTIADFMGLPVGVELKDENAVIVRPFNAYAHIINEWFRDQNLQDPVHFDTGQERKQGTNGKGRADIALGGYPFKASKKSDYFTSAQPAPLKGRAVELPLGAYAPIVTRTEDIKKELLDTADGLRMYTDNDVNMPGNYVLGVDNGIDGSRPRGAVVGKTVGDNATLTAHNKVSPKNLWADLQSATSATINDLRFAIVLQQLLELDLRAGTRYTEIIYSEFGVSSDDSRLQRPEYLGGLSIQIQNQQVLQTSASERNGSPQANESAYSLTNDGFLQPSNLVNRSFTEHGYIMILCVVRTMNTYEQGVHKLWSKKNRLDHMIPMFAGIGDEAILNKEIYATGTEKDNEVFGYNERYADLRYIPNKATGYMKNKVKIRTNLGEGFEDGLGVLWGYGTYFDDQPILSDEFIQETELNVAKTLAVEDTNMIHQWLADFRFNVVAERVLPAYAVPGLDRI